MCTHHLARWTELVRVKRTRLEGVSDIERYEFYVNKNPSLQVQKEFGVRSDCWIWTGGLHTGGYGSFHSDWYRRERGSARAHIFQIVRILGQEIDPTEETDHLCRVRPCSNPDHLERISQRENTLRGIGFSAVNAAKTRCDNGHEFTPENVLVTVLGHRKCAECNRIKNREYTSRPEVKAARVEASVPITGVRGKGQYQVKDVCKKNHKLEGENLVEEKRTRNGVVSYVRRCRICVNEKARDNHSKRKAKM